eukprot:gnl/Dysnectes_brevis/4672_a6388_811.p1 GENE.gnl/Dysnectes_brevis/4672_a6388_811~~gnl/Dysnectes_brevis/4672_a6388_811.p1  ORF type:complete len:297 (-),score=45.28 gnl/Dysnectes_brevis/4672_a6388_811:84-950(-)
MYDILIAANNELVEAKKFIKEHGLRIFKYFIDSKILLDQHHPSLEKEHPFHSLVVLHLTLLRGSQITKMKWFPYAIFNQIFEMTSAHKAGLSIALGMLETHITALSKDNTCGELPHIMKQLVAALKERGHTQQHLLNLVLLACHLNAPSSSQEEAAAATDEPKPEESTAAARTALPLECMGSSLFIDVGGFSVLRKVLKKQTESQAVITLNVAHSVLLPLAGSPVAIKRAYGKDGLHILSIIDLATSREWRSSKMTEAVLTLYHGLITEETAQWIHTGQGPNQWRVRL